MMVTHHAQIIENHGRAIIAGKGWPFRETAMIRIAAAREIDPGQTHLVRQRKRGITTTSCRIHKASVIENIRNFRAMPGHANAIHHRRFIGEHVAIHRRALLIRL